MLEIALIPVLLYSAYMIRSLTKMRKHDKILYQFCQLRRDIATILRRDAFEMNKTNYVALRELMFALDAMIHNYNECKATIFNMRKFVQFAERLRKSARKMESIDIPDNREIKQIYQRSGYAMFSAFLAFTPFIKSEITFKFILYFLHISSKILRKNLYNYQKKLDDFFPWFRQECENFGVAC